MRANQYCLYILFVLLLQSLIFVESKTTALIIGNNNYLELDSLNNPVFDAKDVSTALQDIGVQNIHLYQDLTASAMQEAVSDFISTIEIGDLVFIYYAGHGVQLNTENYLIPVDLKAEDIREEAISLNTILKQLATAGAEINVVILDACRNIPAAFAESESVGLATVEVGPGFVVAFSTAPFETALDGLPGETNSPYAKQLKQYLRNATLDIDTVLTKVRYKVAQDSELKQQPHNQSLLPKEYYLSPNKEQFETLVSKTITVTSQPSGASVLVDGQLLGNTPLTVEVQGGNRVITWELNGYLRQERTEAIASSRDIGVIEEQRIHAVLQSNDTVPEGQNTLVNTNEELLDALERGGKIVLSPGRFSLSEPVKIIDKTIELQGAGEALTTISFHIKYDEENALTISNSSFVAQGLAIKYIGNNRVNVLRVHDSELFLKDCGISGGYGGEDLYGNGIYLTGNSSGSVKNCVINKNKNGIALAGSTNMSIHDNQILSNSNVGIIFIDDSQASALNNVIRENTIGIQIQDAAEPHIEGNDLSANTESGLLYAVKAAGEALNNTIENNGSVGIFVGWEAAPIIQGNTIRGNKQGGVLYKDSSSGEFLQNFVEANQNNGLNIIEGATPVVTKNVIDRNQGYGIYALAQSSQVAFTENNALSNNQIGPTN